MISLRPFAPGDAQGVADVIVPIQREEFGIAITLEQQPDLGQIPAFYQHGLGNFWVADAAGEIVGTIGLVDIGDRQVALRKMFVKAAYRGREHGVAQLLLETALDWCEAHGVADIYLGTTSRFLAAHRFYERNGFVSVAPEELPIGFPRMAVDTRFYRLPIVTIQPETAAQPFVRTFLDSMDADYARLYPSASNHRIDITRLDDPAVSFLVMRQAGDPIGCGALIDLTPGVGELKRVYLVPARRGLRLSRRMLSALEAEARRRGLHTLRLETGHAQTEALSLYRRAGFVAIEAFAPYGPDPVSVFMEKRL